MLVSCEHYESKTRVSKFLLLVVFIVVAKSCGSLKTTFSMIMDRVPQLVPEQLVTSKPLLWGLNYMSYYYYYTFSGIRLLEQLLHGHALSQFILRLSSCCHIPQTGMKGISSFIYRSIEVYGAQLTWEFPQNLVSNRHLQSHAVGFVSCTDS